VKDFESVSEPDVPVTWIVAVCGVAAVEACRIRSEVWVGVRGFWPNVAVTSEGKPLTVKLTLPEKPFFGAMDTDRRVCSPAITKSEFDENSRAKLGWGLGGVGGEGGGGVEELDPPPQPELRSRRNKPRNVSENLAVNMDESGVRGNVRVLIGGNRIRKFRRTLVSQLRLQLYTLTRI
jgi:hypothetical protein